jgi:hypothetical protein
MFLQSYVSGIPGITFGELLLIIACLLIIFQNRFVIEITKVTPLLLLFSISLLISIISIPLQNSSFIQVSFIEVVTRLIRYFTYIFFVTLTAKHLDLKFALKYYRIICLLLSIYILLQFSFYHIFHIMLPIKILPLEWTRIYDVEILLNSIDASHFRAYGVFAEPGYAAVFLLPGFALSLFGWIERKVDYWILFLIAIAIMFTASLQGIIVSIFTVIAFLFRGSSRKFKREHFRKLRDIVIVALILMILLIFFSSLDIFNVAILRIQNIFNNYVEGGGGSTALRLFRGWSVFAALPLFYKIIGIGLGNMANFVYEYNIITKYDSYDNSVIAMEFTDGVSGTLICTGVIGFVLLCRWIISLFKKVSGVHKIILIQFVILLFAGTLVFSPTMVFYMGFIYAGYDINKNVAV